jgi:hypothetical protein
MRVAEKWDGRMPNAGMAAGDWKQRARRAEAEATRAQVAAKHLQSEARLKLLERQMEEITVSTSRRLTEPLRRLNAIRRRAKRRS